MKKLLWFLPVLTLSFCMTSCNNSDEEDPISYYETVAFVSSNDVNPTFLTDFGTILESSTAITSDTGDVFQVGQRVFITFSYDDSTNHVANTYPINIVNYAPVVVKSFKTLKPDSVNPYYDQKLYNVYRLNVTGNYFNSIFYTYQPLTTLNTCELVRIMDNENNDSGAKFPTLSFELRHNAFAVSYDFYIINFFSYDLSPLISEFSEADSINLNISWKGQDGKESYDFFYKPVLQSVGHIVPI